MKSWLKDFAYRAPLSLPVFLGAAGATFLIAQLTVSSQAFRAARTDPVRSIRYE